MHDPSLDVKAKQKEPAGNIPQKKALRRISYIDTNKNKTNVSLLFQKRS